jgi:hypothetical protein
VRAALIGLAYIASSAFLSSTLAWVWARNRRWLEYVLSTVAVWIGLSMLPPIDYPHFLASLIAFAPFALLPALFLVPMVLMGVAARKIVMAGTVASIFAVPLTFFSGLYASCYVLHDCP